METQGETLTILTSMRLRSGSGLRIGALAKHLALSGRRVVMTGIGRRSDAVDGPYRVVCVPDTGGFIIPALLIFFCNLFIALTTRTAVIMVSKPLPPALVPAVIARWLWQAPLVLDYDDVEHDYWRYHPVIAAVLKRSERVALRTAQAVTTHSPSLQRYIRAAGVEPMRLWRVPQGVDTALFVPASPDPVLQAQTGLTGKRVAVFAAHFNLAAADFGVILEAFAAVCRSHDDACLLVIGDGPLRAGYEAQAGALGIGDRVRFTGYVPHAAIARYFALANLAVHYLAVTAANRCRSSIKLREYVLAGLPVLCNDIGDDLDDLRSLVTVFPTGDRAVFAQLFGTLLYQDVRPDAAAVLELRSRLSWENIAETCNRQIATLGVARRSS